MSSDAKRPLFSSSNRKSPTKTFAPWRANNSAVARPIPLAPPVTIATRSFRLLSAIDLPRSGCRCGQGQIHGPAAGGALGHRFGKLHVTHARGEIGELHLSLAANRRDEFL